MSPRNARIVRICISLAFLCVNLTFASQLETPISVSAAETAEAALLHARIETAEQEPIEGVRVIATPISSTGEATGADEMYTSDEAGGIDIPLIQNMVEEQRWYVAIDGLEWELIQPTIIDRHQTFVRIKPAPLNVRYQRQQLKARTLPASILNIQLVDRHGKPVRHVRTIVERIDAAPESTGVQTNITVQHRLGDAYTNENGEMFALNDTPIKARNNTQFRVRLDSNTWDVDNPVIEATDSLQVIRVSRYPIIFVPGIMGSYLDYQNQFDGDRICNLWPTSVNWYSTGGCRKIDTALHGTILQNLLTSRVYPTDVIREQSGHLSPIWGNMYVKFLNTLGEHWPELNKDDGLDMGRTSMNRCNIVKTGVASGNFPPDQTLLFAFGYDWRLSTKKNAESLSQFISCVREIHPNKRINLVGHSMGGLVIKQLLLNYRDDSIIKSICTFNTPYLGAVRAIQIMGNGEYDDVSKYILEKNQLKFVARRIPGAQELLPSDLYVTVNSDKSKQKSIMQFNGTNIYGKEKFTATMRQSFNDKIPFYRLSDYVGRDDHASYTKKTENVNFLFLTSSDSDSTVEKVGLRQTYGVISSTVDTALGPGDGTVNEFSANRVLRGEDWNPKSIPGKRRVITIGFCGQNLDHTGLIKDSAAIDSYIAFLNDPSGLRSNNAMTRCQNGSTVLSLGKPVLTSPPNNHVTTDGLWPTLTWKPGNGLSSAPYGYRIQVSLDDKFKTLLINTCVSTPDFPSPDVTFTSSFQRKLYWRINHATTDTADDTECRTQYIDPDTWSDTRSFTVTSSNTGASAIRMLPAASICAGCRLPRSDDGSSANAIGLGFTVNYFDGMTDSVYVNTNGNLSFYEPVYEFRSDTIRDNSNPMLAAFYADVDTRNTVSGVVTYGNHFVNGRKAFLVNYTDVGYNAARADKRNTFQIVVIDRSDISAGDFDVEYNYARISWETGERNGGAAGLGGVSARVGFASGQGDTRYYELPGSGSPGKFLDSNNVTGLTKTSHGSGGIKGRHVIQFRNGIGTMVATP